MRLKFLLFVFLLWGSVSFAQDYIYNDTINYLVITEYRGDETNRCYLELTNMGDKPVQLNQFKVGHWGGGHTLNYVTGKRTGGNTNGVRIPVDKVLEPGESYVFAHIKDYRPKKFKEGFMKGDVALMKLWDEKTVQDNMWKAADFYVHITENEADTSGMDMKSTLLTKPFDEQWGGNGFFIQQHFASGDSMVVDQVGAMFNGANGANPDRTSSLTIFPIAGVENAMRTQYLIRRFSVKKGNRDFNNARGVGLDDSEWIPIPINGTAWRWAPWTVGNHGNYVLDQNTLESDVIEVDFANKKLTVPWGIRRGDDIMSYFKEKQGIGWNYVMGAAADSLSHGVQTGDQLNIYVCGDVLSFATFDIVVKDPSASENRVVPASNWTYGGGWREDIRNGFTNWPRVTKKATGMDSIWAQYGGIPYATRVDSLYDVLRKPANAEWKIVYANGVEKPDLSNGDKLRVTSQNGTVRDYYIAVMPQVKNVNALLSSITWPDIPEFYRGFYGWIGDTIPNFGTSVFNYNVQVPLMAEGIPALIATKTDVNSKVEVSRAKNLTGTELDRTISFTVTAEDDTTINKYNVVLNKELDPEDLQPYYADPFISEYARRMYWVNNWLFEIVNPGNQPLDLSNYMIAMGNNDPGALIANTNATNWLNRYEKYIPGYKWANELDWAVNTPYIAISDIAVNPIVLPGDVFVAGLAAGENGSFCTAGWTNPMQTQVDVQFGNAAPPVTQCRTYVNQWGEKVKDDNTFFTKWHTNVVYLFKILNDSIKQGLKPATDINDFELIDVLGESDNTKWSIDGAKNIGDVFSLQRKSHIVKGNPALGGALGTTFANSEYNLITSNTLNSAAGGGWGWPWRMLKQWDDFGKHYFIPTTAYMSTVASVVYKVSPGYSKKELIRGITTGTKVADFVANLIKKNENQLLKVTSISNGAELAMDALLSLNDTLTVLSADSTNTTKYVLEVLAEGLSSNAVITSTRYKITIDVQPKSAGETNVAGSGTVSGFEYGTSLRTVINNITVPAGANMAVINADGSYVPLKQLNFDSTYVFVTVNSEMYLDVLAENGITNIQYRLTPQSSQSAAFVLSDKYSVVQRDFLIDFVPGGINVQSFLSYLVPSEGATMKVVDKKGYERLDGDLADDDKLVVTSADKTVTAVYHIGRLATQYSAKSTYLAYILSKEYAVDQVSYKVVGVSGAETVSSFLTKVTPAAGASVAVVDKNGAVKNNGDINGGDMVKVTSADGKIVVMYGFGPLTSTSWLQAAQIELYPNPSTGKLNVTGVEKGQRIQVYNSVGSAIIDINVESSHEILSIEKQPAGLYMIVVSDQNKLVGKYKAVKY